MGSKSSEPASGGTGTGLAGSKSTAGTAGNAGTANASGGAEGTDDPYLNCREAHDEAPGTPVYMLSQVGGGACQSVTLGQIIDGIHAEHPELADISTLYAPNPQGGGDGSFIYAFQRPDGAFALVFKRGGGDCPAGCTENDYWYFETVAKCEVSAVGYTRRYFDGKCLPADQLAMWGIPSAAPPESICGASNETQDLSGDHLVFLCGQGSQCATSSQGSKPTALSSVVTLHIAQDPADLAHGTVTLSGTGEPLLDGRALTAEFKLRQFHVEEHSAAAPDNCIEQQDVTLDYDFVGIGQRHLSFFLVATPDCANDPNDYCKGSLEADLGGELHAL